MEIGTVEKLEGFGDEIAFIPVGGTRVKLIELRTEESVLWPDLAGLDDAFLHDVASRVADIDQRLADLKARGIPLANEEPRPGGVGARIAFVDSSAFGVAVELVGREGGDLTSDSAARPRSVPSTLVAVAQSVLTTSALSLRRRRPPSPRRTRRSS